MPAWSCTTSNPSTWRYDASAWNPSYQGLPRSRGSGGSAIGETSVALVREPPRREQRDVVAGVDEAVGEQRHDELDAAVAGRRHGKPHRRDDRDTHRPQGNATRARVAKRSGSCRPASVVAMPEPWTTSASASMAGADGIVTLVEGSSFCISSRSGEIDPEHPQGLFFRDTRFLSELRLHAQRTRRPSRSPRRRPTRSARCSCCAGIRRVGAPTRTSSCSAAATSGAACAKTSRSRTSARRRRSARSRSCSTPTSPTCSRSRKAASTSRASSASQPTGTRASRSPTSAARSPARRTSTSAASRASRGQHVHYEVIVPPRGRWSTCMQVTPVIGEHGDHAAVPVRPAGRAVDAGRAARGVEAAAPGRLDRRRRSSGALLDRSTQDLAGLRIFDPEYPDRAVVAAGAPWFMTLFGRDSLLTSWMTMLVDPDLALGTLQTLARFQGTEVDPRTEEEPGRILHEMRFGETASLALGGGRIYYGTADATPLFVMLVGELSRWGNRRDEVDALLPGGRPRARMDHRATATRTATATSSTSARPTAACRTRAGRTPGTRCASPTARSRPRRSRCARCRATCTPRSIARVALRDRGRRSRARGVAARTRRRAEAPLQRRLLGRLAPTAATSRWASTATSARSTASARTWATACGPASSTRRRRRSSRAALLVGDAMFSGWGIRTLSNEHRRLQPDLVPLRQRVAARQRDLRGRAHALRLRRGGAPRDARAGRRVAVVRRPAARSCSRAWTARRLGFPVQLPDVVLAAGVGRGVAAAVPAHAVALRARHPQLEAAPRARRSRLDRHAAPRAASRSWAASSRSRSTARSCTRSQVPDGLDDRLRPRGDR